MVRGADAAAVRVVHRALTAEQARAVADVALRVQVVLGAPVDVEWAMAGGWLLVVQARPITALPRPPAVDVGPGTWIKDVEHYPGGFTAFGASLAGPWVSEGLSSMLASWGGLLDRMEHRIIGGETYVRPVPPGGREGAPPPWWLLGLIVRVAPPLRRRMCTAQRMMRPEVFAEQARAWQTVWQPEVEAAVERLHAIDLAGLDGAALAAHLDEATETTRRALHHHFHLIPLYTVPAHELVQACRELLGWDQPEALELLAGTSAKSSEPTRALADLAERIACDPRARAAVEADGGGLPGRLAAADPGFGAAYAGWCRRYALRCVNSDPGSPVFAERPWLLASLLRDAVHAAADGTPGLAERSDATRTRATEPGTDGPGRPAGPRPGALRGGAHRGAAPALPAARGHHVLAGPDHRRGAARGARRRPAARRLGSSTGGTTACTSTPGPCAPRWPGHPRPTCAGGSPAPGPSAPGSAGTRARRSSARHRQRSRTSVGCRCRAAG